LSEREERVIVLRMSGLDDQAVAEALGLSVETIRTYWRRIRLKMNGETRTQVIASYTRMLNSEALKIVRAETAILKGEIEKRKRMERLLRESESRYRALFENTLDAIFLTDKERRFADVNPAFAKFLGFKREELLGREFEDFLAPEDVDESRWIRKLILNKGVWEGDFNMIRKDGTKICFHFRTMFNVLPGQVLAVAVPRKKLRSRREPECLVQAVVQTESNRKTGAALST